MKLRTAPEGLLVWDEADGRWIALHAAAERHGRGEPVPPDVVTFLTGGDELQARTRALLDACRGDASVTADPARAGLPFTPRSMRAFMVWDSHYTASARMLVKRFFPRPVTATSNPTSSPPSSFADERDQSGIEQRVASLFRRFR
jgi:hypothetical protein